MSSAQSTTLCTTSMAESATNYVVDEQSLNELQKSYALAEDGPYDLESQAPHLEKLAKGYRGRFKESGKWTDALKAHSLYNALRRQTSKPENCIQEAFSVQRLYWKNHGNITAEESQLVTDVCAHDLERIRKETKKSMESVDKLVARFDKESEKAESYMNDFCLHVQEISLACSEEMVKTAEKLMHYSVRVFNQPPPCDFCVIALGSLAKGEATPYSDLEYFFLIEKKNPEIEEYFERLAVTSYFFIGNLGETGLNGMDIEELAGWFIDKQKSGFKIDGLSEQAGNIPTGSDWTSPNNLIVTPEELLRRYKSVSDNPVEEIATKGDLTAMLHYTKLIFSHGKRPEDLLEEFRIQKQQIVPNLRRQEMNEKMFKRDAFKYNFKPDTELIESGYSINTKKDIYRYPSILLYNISILTRFTANSSWETLSGLRDRNEISSSVHQSLKFLLACACYIRLSVYLHHDSQDNRLSVLLPQVQSPKHPQRATSAKEPWYLRNSLFIKHCELAVPLKNHIGKCEKVNVLDLIKLNIDRPTWLTRFQTYYCSHRWVEARDIFNKHIGKKFQAEHTQESVDKLKQEVRHDLHELWFTISALVYSLWQERNYKIAMNFHETVLKLLEAPSATIEEEKENQLLLAEAFDEVGSGYVYLTQYKQAEEAFGKSLELRKQYLDSEHELVGKSYYNIGRALRWQHKSEDAEVELVEALLIYNNKAMEKPTYNYYGDPIFPPRPTCVLEFPPCPDLRLTCLNTKNCSLLVGRILRELGSVYYARKYYKRSFDYFSTAYGIYRHLLGQSACHKGIATCLLTLGFSSDMIEEYDQADRYLRQAGEVTTQLYGPDYLGKLRLLERVSAKLGNRNWLYYKTFIATFLNLPGYKVAHVETAGIGRFLGYHLIHMKHHDLAEELLLKMRDMYLKAMGDHPDGSEIGRGVTHFGLNAWKRGQIPKAVECFIKL